MNGYTLRGSHSFIFASLIKEVRWGAVGGGEEGVALLGANSSFKSWPVLKGVCCTGKQTENTEVVSLCGNDRKVLRCTHSPVYLKIFEYLGNIPHLDLKVML